MTSRTVMLVAIGAVLAGCSPAGLDPLLYDENGDLRERVDSAELERAGLPFGCVELEDEAGDDVVRVPVEGPEGDLYVVGLGGVALCIDEAPPEESSEQDRDETEEPDDREGAEDDDSGGEGLASSSQLPRLLQPSGRGSGSSWPLPLSALSDPTPQPIRD